MEHGEFVGAPAGNPLFDGLLAQCRDLACRRLDEAIAGMLEKADAALSELATKAQNRDTQKLYLEAMDLARTQRAAMEKQFRERYLGEFKQRSSKGKKTGGKFADFDATRSTFELSLVGDDDLAETLKFNEMAAKLRRYCEEEINALDQRVGVLLGDADLPAEENPFSPQAICDAYKKACRALVDNAELRPIFIKLFDDHVLDEVRSVYKAVNDLLVQNAILPKIRYNAPKKDAGGKAAKWVRVEGDQVVGEAGDPQDLFATLQKLMANNAGALGGAGGGGTPGGPPLLAGAELLGSLTQLQLDGLAALGAGAALPGAAGGTTNILHELKSSTVGASMGQMDAMTLDIVARLFDQLFDDPKIPLGAKGLIGRLQIPMLKVAIADKDFFSKKSHPARRLLDKLGEIAIRLPADFNTGSPLFGHLETILQGLVGGYENDVEIFDIVRGQLVALMDREDARIEREAQAAADRVVQEEALAVAKGVAQEEIRARVIDRLPPGAVLEFIVEHWLKLMMIIHVKVGASSDAWKNSLEAMEQLIWSVQPKDSAEERRKLATVVPPLLKRIAAGLEVAGIEHEVREFFFDELMKTHTRIMSAPLKPKDAPPAPAAVAAAPVVLDFTSSITVRNPYGAGEVQVSGLDLATGGGDVDSLRQGVWVEFKAKEGDAEASRPARLIFISPKKTRYIFCDRNEKEYIECTRAEIGRRLRAGEAVVIEEEPEVPFFERIMGGVVSKMRAIAAPA